MRKRIFTVILMSSLLLLACRDSRSVMIKLEGSLGDCRYSGYAKRDSNNLQKSGRWNYWYENGQKSRTGCYLDGEMQGEWTSWYENGHNSSYGFYKAGAPVGRWIFWNEDGELIERVNFGLTVDSNKAVAGMGK